MAARSVPASAPGDAPGPATAHAQTLEELYDAHYARLLRLATLLTGDPAPAEDCVQDVFVTVHRRGLVAAGAMDDPAAYLTRAVVNAVRSAGRRTALLPRLRAVATDRSAGPADAPAAHQAALVAERRRAVLDALARLPRRQREVIALRYYLDLSEAEIAAALGISPGSVKTHASRGAAALRDLLSPTHLQETP